jgi:hypothetical protein
MGRLKLAICSSASFYKAVIGLSYEIERLSIDVVLPKTAEKMKQEGLEKVEVITDWAKSPLGYHGKSQLIRQHFEEITACDAILVTNYMKHGKSNYIGPNVLMEMAIAFYLKKRIYVLNEAPEGSPLIDEILGLEPIFLKRDVTQINK